MEELLSEKLVRVLFFKNSAGSCTLQMRYTDDMSAGAARIGCFNSNDCSGSITFDGDEISCYRCTGYGGLRIDTYHLHYFSLNVSEFGEKGCQSNYT
jgi:hypothetical protein